ncbi:hypothetical protein B5M44_26320 [Shinella sumterensis]|nr:hypothetical protein B5M44_26320 [Shinella sumterensis]
MFSVCRSGRECEDRLRAKKWLAMGADAADTYRTCDRARSCIRPVVRLEYDRWPVWSYADLVQNQLYELVAH